MIDPWSPLLAQVDPLVFTSIIATLLGGGGIGAFVAYRKTGAEAESIAARTLIAVNNELRAELSRRDEEIAKLRERVAILEATHPIPPPSGGN